MTTPAPPQASAPTREERLAAKLRENLRRRKAQAKAQAGSQTGMADGMAPAGESPGALSKPDPSR